MLQNLNDWRAQCSEDQLASFDHNIQANCDKHVISQSHLNKRYNGSYHRALINSKLLHHTIETRDYIRDHSRWGGDVDAGQKFCSKLADWDGCMPVNKAEPKFSKAIPRLLERGVVFERHGNYYLPAELVAEFRSKGSDNYWITLAAKTPLPMLNQLVPQADQETMLKPKPLRLELATWLLMHGQQAQTAVSVDQLDESDWTLLLLLQRGDVDRFETLQQLYPDLPAVRLTHEHYYYNHQSEFSLRQSLEQHMPEQLCKLCRLGLIGIITHNNDSLSATLTLCEEAKTVLKPYWESIKKCIAAQLETHWQAKPCEAEYPAAWSKDQRIWRLWIALHFLPLGVTQQGKMRKNDLKKIVAVLKEDQSLKENQIERIELLVACMLKGELLQQDDNKILPLPINWSRWRKTTLANIIEIARHWESWNNQDEKQALKLLSKLPVACWLKLDEVIEWLRAQSSGEVITADWNRLFCSDQSILLHHLNVRHRCIYLLPEFQTLLKQQPITFAAPGWHGADKKANVHGFISAAGEIQLPPDCNHRILDKLSAFCSISAVEQMITLQLDQKALQRMGANKALLKKTRAVLESIQSPLPQAVIYLFDKQQSQKPVAEVAAASMVFVINDASAIDKLRKTGFEFSQPFKDKPEIVLLDASADACALLKTCTDHGIILHTLIKPVEWISGTASINAWMQIELDREGQWLEIAYQKTRSSKPRQIFACIADDWYEAIYIQGTRKTKQGFTLLKSKVRLEPKHILHLRELGDDEVSELGLDQLS